MIKRLVVKTLTAGWMCVALLAGAAVSAQTFQDAVRSNMILGTSLCIDMMLSGTPPRGPLLNAGFVYRTVARGVNSYGVQLRPSHYFDAPANTVKIEVHDPDQRLGLCQVRTTHLGERDVANLVGQVLFVKHPNAQVRGPTEWTVRIGNNLPLIISVRPILRHKYEPAGTMEVSMSFPG